MTHEFTVGVPVYNGMPFLKETMESLLQQSFSGFDILVINDGSTDTTAQYLASLRDPRIHILHQENQGLTATLNRMLKETETEWMIRQDADDISYPERMVHLRRAMREFPDAGMFYSRAVHYQNGKSLMELQTTVASAEGLRALTKTGRLLSICHSSVAFHRKKLEALGGYRFNLHVEDYDMYWRMALAHDIRFIPEILVGARTGTRGISGSNIGDQALNVLWVQYLLISTLKQRNPLPYEEAQVKLRALMTEDQVAYRLHMRRCLDAIGERKYLSAAGSTLRAAASSPKAFVGRVTRMLSGAEQYVVGQDPELFEKHRDILWPTEP